MNAVLRRRNPSTSRGWALDVTTRRTAWTVSIRKLPIAALASRTVLTRDASSARTRDSAQTLTGTIARPTSARRTSSQNIASRLPPRNRMLPTQASSASAATRCTSPTSLLTRARMSPSGVRA
jgi:hypothetical protein